MWPNRLRLRGIRLLKAILSTGRAGHTRYDRRYNSAVLVSSRPGARGHRATDENGRARGRDSPIRVIRRADLMIQPTVSRCENGSGLRDLVRLGRVVVDLYSRATPHPLGQSCSTSTTQSTLVHGHQQLSLFNARFDLHV